MSVRVAQAGRRRADWYLVGAHAPTDPAFEARFDDAVERIHARQRDEAHSRALWLTHHHPDQYDHCVVIAGRHVCRRCITLYPTTLAFAALTLVGWSLWPEALDPWFIWLPCIPVTVDFVFEQLGVWRYSARRQFLTTLLVGPALGRGIGHELDDSWSWELWGPLLCFCTIWFFAAIEGHRRRGGLG